MIFLKRIFLKKKSKKCQRLKENQAEFILKRKKKRLTFIKRKDIKKIRNPLLKIIQAKPIPKKRKKGTVNIVSRKKKNKNNI